MSFSLLKDGLLARPVFTAVPHMGVTMGAGVPMDEGFQGCRVSKAAIRAMLPALREPCCLHPAGTTAGTGQTPTVYKKPLVGPKSF